MAFYQHIRGPPRGHIWPRTLLFKLFKEWLMRFTICLTGNPLTSFVREFLLCRAVVSLAYLFRLAERTNKCMLEGECAHVAAASVTRTATTATGDTRMYVPALGVASEPSSGPRVVTHG